MLFERLEFIIAEATCSFIRSFLLNLDTQKVFCNFCRLWQRCWLSKYLLGLIVTIVCFQNCSAEGYIAKKILCTSPFNSVLKDSSESEAFVLFIHEMLQTKFNTFFKWFIARASKNFKEDQFRKTNWPFMKSRTSESLINIACHGSWADAFEELEEK